MLLSLSAITKDFPGVRALETISLDLDSGEIHALVGENGAGKSTLIKIICGVYPAGTYSGEIVIDDVPVRFHSVRDSESALVRVIHQELSLVQELTVAENMFLGHEPIRNGCIDASLMRKQAGAVLHRLTDAVSPDDRISCLTIGQQQLVEIAKALTAKARILIFDEPTAALPEQDTAHLMSLIKGLRSEGLGIIYISHKLNEVAELADTISVLRNGKKIASYKETSWDMTAIVRDMTGKTLHSLYPEIKEPGENDVVSVAGVTLHHPNVEGKKVIDDVSFVCRAGEVVGIAGLLGSGRTALLSFLFGVYHGKTGGEMRYLGKAHSPRSPSDSIKQGIALVSEDRKNFGLFPEGTVHENVVVSSLQSWTSAGIINHAPLRSESMTLVQRLNIVTPSLDFIVSHLSGGNQQKCILARFLMTRPRLLLLDDPTRGIDVGAKQEIYRLIHELARSGLAIIFVSSELPEVLGVSHRVVVLSEGRVRSIINHGEKSEEEVLALAAGVT